MNSVSSRLPDKEPRLLLVDDDESHCWALQRAFERRGYAVRVAHSVPQALTMVQDWPVGYATVDLRMAGPSGLALIPRLKLAHPAVRIVVITGFASIATAVEAIKLGALHYLPKPVDADEVEAAFQRVRGNENAPASPCRISVERLLWERIQGALLDHSGNVSAAARDLGMHRRTLQRKLGKHPIRA